MRCVSSVDQVNTQEKIEREESLGEEIANSISHGMAFIAAIVAAPFLIMAAVRHGTALTIVGASIFAVSMVLLYFTSMLYHALPRNRAKKLFRAFDHAAIFLLIAGSYTPYTFGVLRGALGWTLFGVIWALAIFGIVFKTIWGHRHPRFSIILYLLMGWLIVIAIVPLWTRLPTVGMAWLVAGGLSYTLGVYFYRAEHIRYGHFVWHLFTMSGTACVFLSVYFGIYAPGM